MRSTHTDSLDRLTIVRTSNALLGDISTPNYELGEVVSRLLSTADSWRHRKVESLRLLDGDSGRRKVSVDCTPDSTLSSPNGHRIMVPLALISKRPMKDFDIVDGASFPLPTLGRTDDGFLAWSAICFQIRHDLSTELPDGLVEALHDVVHGTPDKATATAVDVLLNGEQLFGIDPNRILDQTGYLLLDLASKFMLTCLLPTGAKTERQILKYSYHWRIQSNDPVTLRSRCRVALGLEDANYYLAVGGASDAASYHLEVHAPPGLTATRLELPTGSSFEPSRIDSDGGSVVHATAVYPEGPESEDAELGLSVPLRGIRTATLIVSVYTATVFILERILPGAQDALLDAADGAVALLLVVPAAYSAFLARSNENALVSQILLPLRVTMLLCSALLLAAAASLVGHLHEPWLTILWSAGAVLSVPAAAAQLVAYLVQVSRRSVSGDT